MIQAALIGLQRQQCRVITRSGLTDEIEITLN
jgi:hypothetical protein